MIKILKPGKKVVVVKNIYKITCPYCSCEFECEAEDFKKAERGINGAKWIDCPCCEKELYLNSNSKYTVRTEEETEELSPNIPIILKTVQIPITDKSEDPCDSCPNKGGPKDVFGNPTVGDSPCEWCPHNKWRVTWSYYSDNTTNSTALNYINSNTVKWGK